ncbi:hypothetical protein GE061_002478 [Apolygus lucorum]|uniref:Cationic amino acid transporter C-terminal domain-containing protein n=1 Tax=Apolygus lucorum TaxID=248454 RepID=A0A8S9X6Z7_APOLU|nr:hypothetical protein GE061_002478 [Apolygus lucorum]
MEYVVNYFWKRIMRRRRLVLLRSPYKKNFNAKSTFIWISSVLLGYEFLISVRVMRQYGQYSIYSYFLAAFLQIVPLWSYLELISVISTSGGLYHYVYAVSNELVGFLTGWFQILAASTYLVAIANSLAEQIDSMLFNNNIEKSLKKYLSFELSFGAGAYMNDYPNLLRFLIIMTAAAFSTAIETANALNTVVFYIILAAICCLCILLSADLNVENFIVPDEKCLSTFFASYYDTSNVHTTIYCLAYMGGNVEEAEKNIPRVMLSVFFVTWIVFTALPLMVSLHGHVELTHPKWVISSVIEQAGGYNLYTAVHVIATCIHCSALFVFFVTLSKIYAAKPNLLLGIVTGILTMVFAKDLMEKISKVTQCLLACIVSVCVMLLRYTDGHAFIMRHKHDKSTITEPFEYAGIAVWTLFGSSVAIGCLTSQWTAGYFIIDEFPITEHPYRLSFAGFIFIIAAGVLIYQKQNVLRTSFRVPFVPFVPVISIILQSFMFLVIPMNCIMALGIWTALGLIFYFTYAMQHSRERLLIAYGSETPLAGMGVKRHWQVWE